MSEFERIGPEPARLLMEQGATVVDIRDPHSFANGHITGAQHLDNNTLTAFVAGADRDQPLIVCCYHGNSSQPAAAYLADQGFARVFSLDGGYELWRQQFPEQIAQPDPHK
ncbi:thiosulfate sulfurtransferase GlpE [uncultured Halopseudomonas sp.]|uniref:thiosulfate sulfurtransferase GlpE n=1 Tax=uncultured Halopseudomonas sp. TaxID=2901193 RepID=UPI0030EF5786|tara:strand:+ start:81394 stop:81726 length:333 start_codon:yes stop_codon:yes gene_type:complete